MELQKLQQECPKALNKLKEHCGGLLGGIAKGIREPDEEGEEYVPNDEHLTQFVGSILTLNPRYLYDFFDGVGVRIGVSPSEVGFTSWNDKDKISTPFPTRKEAEEDAMLKAFKNYETLLTTGRQEKLDFLAAQAQELKLGYEDEKEI